MALSPITGGYRVCAPRNLHACRARAVTSHGAVSFPATDIAASPSCAGQEQRATEQCAGAGDKPYDPANLACLARLGILNALLDDHRGAPAGGGDEPKRLTVRCEEGIASIDLPASL